MVVGMCIGACAPVLLSAIGANVNGKRTSMVYLIFNLTGAVILMVPFYILHSIVDFTFMGTTATSMGIAILNTVFKVSATLLLMPFAGFLRKIVTMLIPDQKDTEEDTLEDTILDSRLLAYPPLALEQSNRAIRLMASASHKNLVNAIKLLTEFEQESFDKIQNRENKVDTFEDKLGDYLVLLNAKPLSPEETRTSAKYFTYIGNLTYIL